MAATWIPVAGTNQWAQKLLAFRNTLQQALNQANELNGKLPTMVSGTDYSPVEVACGLTATGTNTTSTGYSVIFQVAVVQQALNGAGVLQFLNQVG